MKIAPHIFTKNGVQQQTKKLYARFYDHSGTRRTLPLFTDKKSSEDAGRAIERLASYRASGTDIPVELHRFIENTLPSIREKLGAWGIVDAARVASAKSLEEHLADWQQHLRANGRDKDYVELKVGRARRLFEACNFNVWNDIAVIPVAKQLAEWRADPEEDMAPTTSNHYLQAAKQFCNYMREDAQCVTAMPLSRLKPLNTKNDLRHDRRAFTVPEFRFLLGHLRAAPTRWHIRAAERSLIYRFAAGTGLRFTAISEVTVGDFGTYDGSPAVQRFAGAVNKDKDTRWVKFSHLLWRVVSGHIEGKKLNERAFKMPSRRHAAKLVKWDLAAARRRWIAQAKDEKERRDREASDFLKYVNSRGQYLDFHSLRHTRGVWLVQHHGAGGLQVMEALGVHSYELVKRYTRSGKFVSNEMIEREPDLTPTLTPTPQTKPKRQARRSKSLAPSLAQRGGLDETSLDCGGLDAEDEPTKGGPLDRPKTTEDAGLLTPAGESSNVSVPPGEVAEWLNAPVSKTGLPERVAGVRISPSPLSQGKAL